MTAERLPEDWDIEAMLREATDLPELVRSKLSGGLLAAVDGLVTLATSATDERVRVTACREVVELSQALAAVELGPVSNLMREVWEDLGRGPDGPG
jgi:hypothetical protein